MTAGIICKTGVLGVGRRAVFVGDDYSGYDSEYIWEKCTEGMNRTCKLMREVQRV